MSAALPLAIAALVPVMLGPAPAEHTAITATLCNGGTITIPVGDDAPAPKPVFQAFKSSTLNGVGEPPRCHTRKSAPSTRLSPLKSPGNPATVIKLSSFQRTVY